MTACHVKIVQLMYVFITPQILFKPFAANIALYFDPQLKLQTIESPY